MKVSIVIPAYNERATLPEVLRAVRAVELPGIEREIVVVDDASTDGTREWLREAALDGVRPVFQDRNRGKGAALRRGFAAATGDLVLVQDADLEYDPKDHPRVLQPLLEGRADAVYGSRFAGRGGARWTGTALTLVANRFLTWLSNRFTGLHLTDMETGCKAFRADLLRRITLREERFGFEPEVTAEIAAAGARVVEVPATYRARGRAQGKKIGWKDGVRAIQVIWRHRGRG